jgi:hypothetical protein
VLSNGLCIIQEKLDGPESGEQAFKSGREFRTGESSLQFKAERLGRVLASRVFFVQNNWLEI